MNIKRLFAKTIILILIINIVFVFHTNYIGNKNVCKQEQIATEPVVESITLSYDDKLEIIVEQITSEYIQIEYKPLTDKNSINEYINELKLYKTKLENISEDYPEEYKKDINELISNEISAIDEIINQYYSDIDYILLWEKRNEEYPAATQIWLSMKEQGWSDNVCAGIMGNIMAECGGQTLNIKWDSYDSSEMYYGICQWSLYYTPEASGLSLESQLNLLYNTIETEFKNFGFCYRSDFTYEDFLHMNNSRDVALAFAKVYERCSSASYYVRQDNAEQAYEYFCN